MNYDCQLVSEAAQRVLHKDVAEERQKELQQKLKDPVIQQRDRELDIREAQVQAKMKADAEKIAADLQKSTITAGTELERLASQERITSANIAAKLATDEADISSKEKIEGAKIGKEIAQDILHKDK